MHFCSVCDNMYYIRINNNSLLYYCRNCGNEDAFNDNIVVSQTNVKKTSQTFNHIINKYTKFDPTLPRMNKILCPNSDCKTNTKDEDREIIYIRYDDANMKYVYLCSSCDTVWKPDN